MIEAILSVIGEFLWDAACFVFADRLVNWLDRSRIGRFVLNTLGVLAVILMVICLAASISRCTS